MKKIKIIGLTGQSGAGKSTVAKYFQKRNIYTVHADELVHKIYSTDSPCVKAVAASFGADILKENGEINRPVLAKKAFSSRESTEMLNSLVHPFVTYEFLKLAGKAAENGESCILYDASQLFESNSNLICDVIISVTCNQELRIKRICERDGIDREAAIERFNAQYDENFFKDNSDYIIENNSDLELLISKTEKLFDRIFSRGD